MKPSVAVILLWLDDITPAHRPLVGGKAANLAALRQAGLPVPAAFCLPAPILASGEWEDPDCWAEVAAAYHCLSDDLSPRVAVRSSGLAEDGAASSYAGQYESLLGVQGEDELRRAIHACREAAAKARVSAYRQARGEAGAQPDALAVLVQRQVEPAVSGVLFTRNPLGGAQDEMVLEAAPGLGDALVGGRVSPVPYRLDRNGREFASPPGGLLAPAERRKLVELGQQVERLLGPGQDIEWALVRSPGGDSQVYAMQARPITAGAGAPALDQVWTRANVGEVLPEVVTPLTWAVFTTTLLARRSASPALDEFWRLSGEVRVDAPSGVRLLSGRVYLRLDALLDSFCYLPGVTPEVLGQVLGVELPIAGAYRRPGGVPVRLAQAAFWLEALGFLPRLAWLARRLPPTPQPGSNAENLPALLAWTANCFALHLKATAYAIALFGQLTGGLAAGLPADTHRRLPGLLLGQADMQTADQGRALWVLAGRARPHPALSEALQHDTPWPELQKVLAGLDGGLEFLAGLGAFLETHGARTAGEFELAAPRWREDPTFVLAVLRGYLASPSAAPPGVLENTPGPDLLACLDALPPLRRLAFSRLLAAYRRYAALRENLKYRLVEGYALLREAFLAYGTRFVEAGWLGDPAEVFYLLPGEIRRLEIAGDPHGETRAWVAARRYQAQEWAAQPALPLVDGAGHALAASLLPAGRPEGEPTGAGERSLPGIASSPGIAEGRARVLNDPAEAEALQPGEILVAPHTDPGWTPLFLSCAAVVTEIGGFLSHGATVAREYHLPCVVNVHGVMAAVRTGDLIRVDGFSGRVTLLHEPGG